VSIYTNTSLVNWVEEREGGRRNFYNFKEVTYFWVEHVYGSVPHGSQREHYPVNNVLTDLVFTSLMMQNHSSIKTEIIHVTSHLCCLVPHFIK
jgi:hypothetical protein